MKKIRTLPKYKELAEEQKMIWDEWEDSNNTELHYFESFLMVTKIVDKNRVIIPDKWDEYFGIWEDHYIHLMLDKYMNWDSEKTLKMFSHLLSKDEYKEFKQSTVDDIDQKRNDTWTNNHARIQEAYHNAAIQQIAIPTVTQLSKLTGLSRVTITKHLKEINTSEYYQANQNMLKLGAQNVTAALYQWAIKGNIKAAGLYLKVAAQAEKVEHQKEVLELKKQMMLQPKKTNNFIQINNTKVDINTIESLPVEQQKLIAEILNAPAPQVPPVIVVDLGRGVDPNG